jgi:hypothetical protein
MLKRKKETKDKTNSDPTNQTIMLYENFRIEKVGFVSFNDVAT